MIPKRPGEGEEIEQIETRELVNVDIFVEREPHGVVLTLAADDTESDVSVLLSPTKAREMGDLLFRVACADPPTTPA